MLAQQKILLNVIEKWAEIDFSIKRSIYDPELANYIENISAELEKLKSSDFTRSNFEHIEIYIVLLESRLDELIECNEMSKKLWGLINCSLYNFFEFLSYLMISNKKK